MAKFVETCKLCLADDIVNGLQITSSEGKTLQIATIIYNHFPSIFLEPPQSGWVCNDCWSKLHAFHEFYLIVEAIHISTLNPEIIKVEIEEPIECKQEPIEYAVNEITDIGDLLEGNDILNFNEWNDNRSESDHNHNADSVNDPDYHNDEDDDDDDFHGFWEQQPKPEAQTEAKKEVRSRKCEDCGKRLSTRAMYEKHKKEAHPLPFKCKGIRCIESFSTTEDLEEHIKEFHTRAQCPQCKRVMYKHCIPAHIEKDHRRILCELCGAVCINTSGLSSHRRIVHKVEPVECNECGKWLDNKRLLRDHKKYSHNEKEKSKECPICGKVLKYHSAVKIHMKVHSEGYREKYKCDICDKCFPRRVALREHLSIHSGINIYNCKICGQSFRYSQTLCLHRKKCF